MLKWTSVSIALLSRVVRPTLLEHVCISVPGISLFSLTEISKAIPPDVETYLKKEALNLIKVLITVSAISLEWHILIQDPTFFFGRDIHVAVVQVLVAYSSIVSAARCGLNITKDPIGGHPS